MPLIHGAISRATRPVGRWCPATLRIRRLQPAAAVSEMRLGEAARPASSEIQRQYSTSRTELSIGKRTSVGLLRVALQYILNTKEKEGSGACVIVELRHQTVRKGAKTVEGT